MDRYEVMAGKMTPLTDGAHRKWGFTGKVETRSYERLVDALIDFVETGDGLKARFHRGRESERVSAKGTCAVRVNIGAGEGALREAGEGQIP